MDRFASIRNKAFINELHKIAVKTGHTKDIFEFVKQAAYIDEIKIISDCGSGKTYSFTKSAEDYSITPGYWEGKKGLHRAISEDPKTHSMILPKYLGASLGASIVGGQIAGMMTNKKNTEKIFVENPEISQMEFKKLFRKARWKSSMVPSMIAGLFAGELVKHKLENSFLNQYGIKKNLIDPRYHFTPEAYQKYYQ